MRRLPVDDLSLDFILLNQSQNHYLTHVLRLAAGAFVEVFDGRGNVGLARLQTEPLGLAILTRQVSKTSRQVTIAMNMPKGQRADFAVEKLAELGVHEIIWLICERSVVLPKKDSPKLLRFERLAKAAARQAGLNFVPMLHAPQPFSEFVATCTIQNRYIAQPGLSDLDSSVRWNDDCVVLIGPEGGFTHQECVAAQKLGYKPLGLGNSILRVETAALVCATLAMFP